MALKDLLTAQDFQSAYLQQYPLHSEFSYGAGPVIASGQKGDPKSGVVDFKTTPFGKDQPKGGSSRQPYIKTKIPIGDDNYAFKPYATFGGAEVGITSGGGGILETINSISSGLIRGGVITAGIHSATDVLRLAQFGIDLERGIPFIAKQVGLQLSNVKLEAPSVSALPFNNTRIYNLGVNTMAQAGVNAFGIHFKRHGLSPKSSDGQDDKTGYYKLVTSNNRLGYGRNRLYRLLVNLSNNKEEIKELYSYNGGPKSVYGIGKTTIRSYTNTLSNPRHDVALISSATREAALSLGQIIPPPGTRINQIDLFDGGKEYSDIIYPISRKIFITDGGNKDYNLDFPHTKNNTDPTSKTYTTLIGDSDSAIDNSDSALYNYLNLDQPTSQLSRVLKVSKKTINLSTLTDFRRNKATLAKGDEALKSYYLKNSSDYGASNMESRLGIGTGFDRMGELKIIRTKTSITPDSNEGTRDLVNFFIEAIDNDSPSKKDHIQFRAFLNSFNENYKAKWKGYNFVGNPESFYNYESFDRGISLSFTIAAFRVEELKPLYVKLNTLISQLFPDYAPSNTRSRAPYVTLTVGDYLNRQPGFIESLGIKWDKNISWEIGPLDGTDPENITETQVLPHALSVDMKFQPIHNFVPRKITSKDSDVPFITLNSRNSNSQDSWIGEANNYQIDPSLKSEYKAAQKRAEKERIKQEKKLAEAREAAAKEKAAEAKVIADELEAKKKQQEAAEKAIADEAAAQAKAKEEEAKEAEAQREADIILADTEEGGIA